MNKGEILFSTLTTSLMYDINKGETLLRTITTSLKKDYVVPGKVRFFCLVNILRASVHLLSHTLVLLSYGEM